jgi:hypothetical protein
MPVRKFRHLEEMEDALWRKPGDPALWRAIDAVWAFAAETCPQRFPPGVYRHRNLQEAERLRDRWEEDNFKAFWSRRGVDPERLAGEPLHPGTEREAGAAEPPESR